MTDLLGLKSRRFLRPLSDANSIPVVNSADDGFNMLH